LPAPNERDSRPPPGGLFSAPHCPSHRPSPRPSRVAHRLKCVRIMCDDKVGSSPEERQHVVAHFSPMRAAPEISVRESDEPKLLVAVDGFEAFTCGETLPGFHFDERQDVPPLHDEVDLASAQSDVATHDRVSAHPIEPDRPPLAKPPQLLRIHVPRVPRWSSQFAVRRSCEPTFPSANYDLRPRTSTACGSAVRCRDA